MKQTSILMAIIAMTIALGSCTKSATSYANELKAEKKLIEEYIERNHIHIIYEAPEYDQWGENDYLEVGDYCYFHLTQMGDTTSPEVEYKDEILLRYRRYTLNANPDTLSYWNTNELAYPITFQYSVSSDNACSGWHFAVAEMKYTGAEGKLICPSKMGFTDDNSGVTPYGYDLKIQIKRF